MIKSVKSIKNRISAMIRRVENPRIPFIYFILTFFAVIILRIFLELFPGYNLNNISPVKLNFDLFLHHSLFYVSIALAFILLFYYATKEKIDKIARIVLPAFLITAIVPIIDLILSLGKGYNLDYGILTLFGPLLVGITPGLRVEAYLIILGSFIYFLLKKGGLKRSLVFSLLSYYLLFFYVDIPFFIRLFFPWFVVGIGGSHLLMINFYLLLNFVLLAWLFYLYKREYFISILRGIQPFRLLHYGSMFALGIVFAKVFQSSVILMQYTLFHFLFIILALVSAWLFSVITNNQADYNIDKITKEESSLVSGAVPVKDYRLLGWIFLALAIVYSSAVSFITLFLIVLFIGNYFLYSMPPLRLKRITFFSKLTILFNSLLLVLLGYFFMTDEWENLLPLDGLAVLFLVVVTGAINFIDIKDYEGDKQAGVKTLPVILGLKKSRLIIGLFFLLSYLLVALILKDFYLSTVFLLFGVIQFFLLNKSYYNEKPIFLVYFISLITFIVYFLQRMS